MTDERVTTPDIAARYATFDREVRARRIPLGGSIDLTYRCNLRCVHCYCGVRPGSACSTAGPAQSTHDPSSGKRRELSTDQVLDLLDQIVEAGCLVLLITGGEPLLRSDFHRIYQHARRAGLLVTVFTNGTLLNDSHVTLFRDLPPHGVEVSVYGACDETAQKVTGVPGAFSKAAAAVERLKANGINVMAKTVVLKENAHELEAIERFFQDRGVRHRMSADINARLDGDLSVKEHRLSPPEAVAIEFADASRAKGWKKWYERASTFPTSDSLFKCGGGWTNFGIDPFGGLHPCLLASFIERDLTSMTFADAWASMTEEVRSLKVPAGHQCSTCDKLVICGWCPAFAYLEHGDAFAACSYLCEFGSERLTQLKTGSATKGQNNEREAKKL